MSQLTLVIAKMLTRHSTGRHPTERLIEEEDEDDSDEDLPDDMSDSDDDQPAGKLDD